MRFIQLSLAAFLPFRTKQVVDFDELLQDHVFLICGATGSGKTSLFDAICFALFGRTSGSIRDVSTLKSQFATDSEKSYVTLTFALQQQTYEVYRTPVQPRVGRNGKRMIDPATARLTLPDGEVVSGVREVDRRLEELLGITLAQFRKIIMLPQGEFQRFLIDSSTAKQEILKQIFDTAPYAAIESHLRETYRLEKENMTALRATRQASLTEMRCFLQAKDLLPAGEAAQTSVTQMQALLEADAVAYEQILQVGEQLRQDLQTLLEQTSAAVEERQQELYALDLDRAAQQNKQLEALWETRYAYDRLLSQLPEMERLRQELDQLQQVQSLVQRQQQCEQNKISLQQVNTAWKTQQEALPSLTQQLVAAQQERAVAEQIQRNLPARLDEITKLEQLLTLFAKQREIIKAEQTIAIKQQQLAGLFEAFAWTQQWEAVRAEREELGTLQQMIAAAEQADRRYLEQKDRYQKQFQAFLASQASLLSQHLVEGEPCPVCGSTHHPKLDTPAGTTEPSGETASLQPLLQQAKADYETALAQLSQSQTALSARFDAWLEGCEQTPLADVDKSKGLSSYARKRQMLAQREATLAIEEGRIQQERSRSLEGIPPQPQQAVAAWGREDYVRHTENLKSKRADLAAERRSLELQTAASEEGQVKEQLSVLKASIQADQAAYEQATQRESQLRETLARHEQAIGFYEQQREALQASMARDQAELAVELQRLSLTQDQLTMMIPRVEQLSQLTQQWSQFEAACENQRGRLLAYEQQAEGMRYQKIEQLNEQKQQATIRYQQCQAQQQKLSQVNTLTEQAWSRLQTSDEAYRTASERFEQVNRLYQVATGTAGGRVSFERYVLGMYFDRVLHHANQRLNSLTDGRYQMRRREEAEKGNAASGLELEVLDAQNGRYRHVNMMSGGESFQMALALSLGFADVITHQSGGTELSTLLIDEGFGTLDQEALDQAIGVLTRLKHQGKQIGMISHVRELQERVRHKLVVEQSKQGSHCRFVID